MSGEVCEGHQRRGGCGGRITHANEMGGDMGHLKGGGLKLPSPGAVGVDDRGWCFAAAARDEGCSATSLFYQPKDVINSNSLPFCASICLSFNNDTGDVWREFLI